MKQSALLYGTALKLLSEEEVFALKETSVDVNDKGELFSRVNNTRFLNSLLFSFKIYSKVYESPFVLDIGTVAWECMRCSVKVRDRLTHPKNIEDLFVSSEELEKTKIAFLWYYINNQLCYFKATVSLGEKANRLGVEFTEKSDRQNEIIAKEIKGYEEALIKLIKKFKKS